MWTFDLIKAINGFGSGLKGYIKVFEKDELKSTSTFADSITGISSTNKSKNIHDLSDHIKSIRNNNSKRVYSIGYESCVEIIPTIKESSPPLVPLDLWMK